MFKQVDESRRRFRIVLLEERIAPTSVGYGGGHHGSSGDGDSDTYTPVVTHVTVVDSTGTHNWSSDGSAPTSGVTSVTPVGAGTTITFLPVTLAPGGTNYSYQSPEGWGVDYYVAPPPPETDGLS